MADLDPRAKDAVAPTRQAEKLVRRDYGERVLADLGTQRILTDQVLRATVGEFNPDRVSLMDRRRMRRDPQIKMALYYTKALLTQAERTIKCEDPAIKAAMEEQVRNVHTSIMRSALNMFDFGFQAGVRQYGLGKLHATYEDPDSGEIAPVWADDVVRPVILGEIIPVPPEHAKVALKDGRFNGFNTSIIPADRRGDGEDNPDIPREFAIWFTNEFEEEFRNYYGVARIDPAYEPWYAYWFTHHMRNRHIEQDADPALQVWYPTGTYVADGERRSNRDAALEIGAKLRGGATIAWPSEVHISEDGKATSVRLWEAQFLQGGENLAAFNDVLNDLRLEKLRACLVPEEALAEALRGTGSRATSGNRIDIFTQSMEMAANYLDRLWTKYLLRPVVEANWGSDAPPCEMETTGFREEDLTFTQELITAAFSMDPNALPIKWEELLDRTGIPQYTAAEQKEREEADAEAQRLAQEEAAAAAEEAAAAGMPPGGPGDPTGGAVVPPPGQTPAQLAASQDDRRSGSRKYEREVIHLSTAAPDWAKREGARREKNIAAVSERMLSVIQDRYEAAFAAATDAVAELSDDDLSLAIAEQTELALSRDGLDLAIGDAVNAIVRKIKGAISAAVGHFSGSVQGEMASMYHATGMAELNRLGLSAESWDVGRDEVQEWARWRAGELIKTMDRTIVENHVRPFLAKELQNLGIQDPSGIPYGALELAERMSEKFEGYPTWMSERVIRTEARTGYNLSALDMWERVGVYEVEAYDGLGGKTGQTDEHCLARNGLRLSIEEAREENEKEHPNGTLGFVPVAVTADLQPLDPGILDPEAIFASASIYGVTTDGLILSVEEVGRAMAA